MILPKGFVINSPEINGQIEQISANPLEIEEIAKFWKVYTTTKRRLLDPTAERLENYWWRIWGSRRRELNAATVARLFAYISDGQSFVPLRGPANRDEGSPPLNTTTRHGPGASSATALHHPSQSRPSTTSSSTASKAPAPMPHPILKKTRGPSTTGPRPTARFISPHESEAETGTTTNSSTRSVSPNSHVVVQPPSPDSQNLTTDKKATVAGGGKKKGRVIPSAAKKTRPQISKRQSSQSSTDSGAKVEAATSKQSSAEKTPPTFSEVPHGKGKAPSRFQENFSPDHLGAQSSRKRQSSKSADAKGTSPRKPSRKGSEERKESASEPNRGESGPSFDRSIDNQLIRPGDVTEEELNELALQRTLLDDANARVKKGTRPTNDDLRVPQTSHRMTDGSHDQDLGAMRLLPQHDAKSTASAAPTLTDATGQLDLSDTTSTSLSQVAVVKGKNKGKGRDPDEVQRTEMFAKRPVPPVSGTVPIAEGSLARSKSQLTLLLERDRARSGEHKSRDEKKE